MQIRNRWEFTSPVIADRRSVILQLVVCRIKGINMILQYPLEGNWRRVASRNFSVFEIPKDRETDALSGDINPVALSRFGIPGGGVELRRFQQKPKHEASERASERASRELSNSLDALLICSNLPLPLVLLRILVLRFGRRKRGVIDPVRSCQG